jgi:hypothetical protein
MTDIDPRTYPARPPSEVEWEDLLVKLEIAPRAIRIAVEDAPADHPDVLRLLQLAAESESLLQRVLLAMADGTELPEGIGAAMENEPTPAGFLAEYTRRRARTFAIVQRRGLGVWDWTARGGPFPGVSTYQLLQGAAALDGQLLAEVRRVARAGAGA